MNLQSNDTAFPQENQLGCSDYLIIWKVLGETQLGSLRQAFAPVYTALCYKSGIWGSRSTETISIAGGVAAEQYMIYGFMKTQKNLEKYL